MSRVAWRSTPPLTSAEAPLAYVFSPLVGTPLTTSAKFAVVARSPLTGMLTDALASSHFAIAGKLTGYDAIVVRGSRPEPSVLLVDEAGPRFEDAKDLAGLTAAQTSTALRHRLGRGWRVAAIGPAGERGVRYATISHDGRHAAGIGRRKHDIRGDRPNRPDLVDPGPPLRPAGVLLPLRAGMARVAAQLPP